MNSRKIKGKKCTKKLKIPIGSLSSSSSLKKWPSKTCLNKLKTLVALIESSNLESSKSLKLWFLK